MSIHNHERTLALAGVMQASMLVNQVARGRWTDQHIISASIESLFVFNPKNVLEVYGNDIDHLQFGLRRLTTFFPKPDKQHDGELANYLFSTILLARLLLQDKPRLERLSTGLEQIQRSHQFDPNKDEEELYAKIAQLYVTDISTFKRRINIVGSREILQQPREVNTIRALLLAAIRASILWHQVGGRLWHLWWKRSKLVDSAHELLNRT